MYYLFVILIVLAALLMIGIVLIQESKGGGLSSNFSAGNALAGVLALKNTCSISRRSPTECRNEPTTPRAHIK